MTAQDIIFWALAGLSVGAAIAVVTMKSIFRAAVVLAMCFLTVAGLFVLLNADFLAVVQVLIYVGAISVLMAFAALLTRDAETGNAANRLRVPAVLGAALTFVILAAAVLKTKWPMLEDTIAPASLARVKEVFATTPQWLAGLLLKEWALPFEVASVLLLAAIVGALVLVRERQA